MPLNRDALPDPAGYYEGQGLALQGRGKWRSAPCVFHGSNSSMRINTASGAYVCMAGCGARGGDVLAYHMAAHGLGFIDAARDLRAWVEEEGKPKHQRPAPFPARDALAVLAAETLLVAVAAANVANGATLNRNDLDRLLSAARRINKIAELFH